MERPIKVDMDGGWNSSCAGEERTRIIRIVCGKPWVKSKLNSQDPEQEEGDKSKLNKQDKNVASVKLEESALRATARKIQVKKASEEEREFS